MIISRSLSRRRERGGRSQKSFLTERGREFADRMGMFVPVARLSVRPGGPSSFSGS
jgi:hypothetical protein